MSLENSKADDQSKSVDEILSYGDDKFSKNKFKFDFQCKDKV